MRKLIYRFTARQKITRSISLEIILIVASKK